MDKMLFSLEKTRFSLISGLLVLTFYMAVRWYVEWRLYSRVEFGGESYVGIGLYNLYPATFFSYLAFLGGVLVITVLSKEGVRRVANVVLCSFWLIVSGPLLDFFVFGREERYEFIAFENMENAPTGLAIQLLLIIVLSVFYVVYKTRSPTRGILTALLLFLAMFLIGSVPFYIMGELQGPFGNDFAQVFLGITFFIAILLITSVLISMADRRVMGAIMDRIRLSEGLYLILISVAGIAVAGRFLFDFTTTKGAVLPVFIDDIPFAVMVGFTVFFGAQFLFMKEEDITESKGWAKGKSGRKNPLNKYQFRQLTIMMASLSILFSVSLGMVSFALAVLFVFLAGLYHSGMIKDFPKKRPILMGIESVIVFFIGYFTSIETEKFIVNFLGSNYAVLWPQLTSYSISAQSIASAILIFFITILLFIVLKKRHLKTKGVTTEAVGEKES
ncbi:MAG: hypothetical protein JSW28_09935 [Thermoplasmata archaeon]|nr:MAG: hypothetical protein JSW28_09935 [Thermoplasmata archaeon]